MNRHGFLNEKKQSGRCRLHGLRGVALALLIAAVPLSGQDKHDKDKHDKKDSGTSIGFILSDEATAKEVGLPVYPGARPHKDQDNDTPALQMGLWGKSSGFKLVVLKLESDDAPEKVAAFYRKALAKYGQVVDCGRASSAASDDAKSNSSDPLDCKSDRPQNGGFTLKAGTKEKQHVVGIQRDGSRSLFQLVYVETPKSD